MSTDNFAVLGFDVGGTKIAVCVADSQGQILAHQRVSSQGSYQQVLPLLVAAGRAVVAEAGLDMDAIRACGICAPGPLDIDKGLLLKSPNMAWDDVPIRDDLGRDLGVQTFLQNDANAGVLAEWLFGAAQGFRHVIYLTMSTGIGGGIVADGQLVEGITGQAGELGHAILDLNGPLCGCGMRGCLEAYCGGRNVARRLQQLLADQPEHAIMRMPEVQGDLSKLSFQVLREAARREIPLALEMWDEICLRLAQGIGLYMMTFNPEVIVLGTSAFYAGDFLLAPVRRYLPRFAWAQMLQPCRLEVTALGSKIGEMAGISVALYGLQHCRN